MVEVDGERLLMVATELTMVLFALLYAFPHVPARLLPGKDNDETWFSVGSLGALRSSVLSLLHTSVIMNVTLQEAGRTIEDLRQGRTHGGGLPPAARRL